MTEHRIVGHSEWREARRVLLEQEKAFTRARDELSRTRRELPWERVEKHYVFDGPRGEESLAELFEGRSQLIVYHFMFGPEAEVGCKSCAFWADNFDGIVQHLKQRDVTLVAVSRAPLAKLRSMQERLGWSFKWLSSGRTDFNFDYDVSFSADARAAGTLRYNYAPTETKSSDLVGVSVFYRDASGGIFHTYSCYARGVDMLNTAYHYLDLTPKGRDEDGLPYTMAWVKLRDQYDSAG
jgi:predicted dithiol-disulfide oxidoreductase (DUF899 family)